MIDWEKEFYKKFKPKLIGYGTKYADNSMKKMLTFLRKTLKDQEKDFKEKLKYKYVHISELEDQAKRLEIEKYNYATKKVGELEKRLKLSERDILTVLSGNSFPGGYTENTSKLAKAICALQGEPDAIQS